MYVRNTWYLAAWSEEVSRQPLARTLLGEPVVFYRDEVGGVVALLDRCPHRLVPLSKGEVIGDDIRCAYHGAMFSPEGACLRVPGVPDTVRPPGVRAFEVREQWGGIFIWMGEERGVDAPLPSASLLELPGWRAIHGMLPCGADYQLAVDNLLDLSHEAYLHPNTIGTMHVAELPVKTTFEDTKVIVTRVMPDVPAPPLFGEARRIDRNIDRHQTVTAELPSFVTVDVKATPVGEPDQADPLSWQVLFFMTPERAGRTHYFFAVSRNFAQDSVEVDRILLEGSLRTLREDIDMLEAQQAMLAEVPLESRTLYTRYDAAPDRARVLVKRMIEREQAARAIPRAAAA